MSNFNFANFATRAVGYWVTVGALSGAALSGTKKMVDILQEPSPKYVYPQIERPIRGVYHTSRIAGHAGWGAAIAGFFAATFPVSIPTYMLIRLQYDQKQEPDSDTVPAPEPNPVPMPEPKVDESETKSVSVTEPTPIPMPESDVINLETNSTAVEAPKDELTQETA